MGGEERVSVIGGVVLHGLKAMSAISDRKELPDLNLQLWRIKDERSGQWRDEVYLMGDDDSLRTLIESLQAVLNLVQTYGKGTRKYKCNPPADFDHRAYGKDHGLQIQWLDKLVVRLGLDAMDNEPYILDQFTVELSVSPNTLKEFIEKIDAYLNSSARYGHGKDAVCGLRLSPDWLGAE